MWQKAGSGVGASGTASVARPPSGGVAAPGGWHPTILYLLALVAAEMVILGFVSKHLLK